MQERDGGGSTDEWSSDEGGPARSDSKPGRRRCCDARQSPRRSKNGNETKGTRGKRKNNDEMRGGETIGDETRVWRWMRQMGKRGNATRSRHKERDCKGKGPVGGYLMVFEAEGVGGIGIEGN
ncbi:hypothetical protein BJV78DRAFT_1158501 [Lactifluus subvellereus]|nr:hypothetical protein BJV78DRAFT_1158501 [Lactifluus subvellereus]